SHVPAIGNAIAKGLQQDPYWKPFFDGFIEARAWLKRIKPDAVVMFYNDHGLNFFLDKMPTFAVGAAPQYNNADEGWGLPVLRPCRGDAEFSWHLIEGLVGDEFDVTTCQEMLVDHAFVVPLQLLWPEGDAPPVVPVAVNTVQHPLASPARCLKLGRSIGRAIASYKKDMRVLVIGTGGLSHQLDGARAGFINKEFDMECIDKITANPEGLINYTVDDIVRLSGTQGVELLNWIAMRGALLGRVSKAFCNYHIPISNTASALLVLDNEAAEARRAA
ncbi:MAG: protocatechuate 3,4-dioxygenase, partial [Alphaproteobacteria bacterium]|nr:protocatechuate 3,4-dioxygenase [Alphaproteobacteria bacterium]